MCKDTGSGVSTDPTVTTGWSSHTHHIFLYRNLIYGILIYTIRKVMVGEAHNYSQLRVRDLGSGPSRRPDSQGTRQSGY